MPAPAVPSAGAGALNRAGRFGRPGPSRAAAVRAGWAMDGPVRLGVFALSAQFPGQDAAAALHRTVRTAEAAEAAGLDAVWLAEHHFMTYGVCPSALTMAAVLLGRTRRIGVGTAVTVLPTAHPVTVGEQAALLHVVSGGRFTLGVGRGGPWQDLEVFGGGLDAYERGFPEAVDLLLRWLREERVAADGPRYRFREVPVVPRTGVDGPAGGPPVLLACVSPVGVRLAARLLRPMLLGMHCDDEEKAAMTALWRSAALEAGHSPERVARVAGEHVAAGIARVADRAGEARAAVERALAGWLREGLAGYVTLDGRPRRARDPHAYARLLCSLHPVGTPDDCAERLARTAGRTGVRRFALLAEADGDPAATEECVARLGAQVRPLLG